MREFSYLLTMLLLAGCIQNFSKQVAVPEKISIHAEISFSAIPEQRAQSLRYDLTIHQSDNLAIQPLLPVQARVYCFEFCPENIEPGSRYQARLLLRNIDHPHNPGGFNYQQWLEKRGFIFTGLLLAQTLQRDQRYSASWHGQVIGWLNENLRQFDYGSQYLALLTGFRGSLSSDDRDVLINTGTMHLLVVSGLHLGFIFILVQVVLFRGMSISRQYASIVALMAMLSYAWMAGFALATQRAFIMALISILWLLTGRRVSLWYGWFIAFIFVIGINQPVWNDAGLWLSFATLGLLLLIFQYQNREGRWFQSLWRSQWYLFPGLCLLQVLFFERFGVGSFAANLVAIPFIGFIVLPVVFIGCALLFVVPPLGEFVFHNLDAIFSIFWQALSLLAQQEWITFSVAGERKNSWYIIGLLVLLVLLHIAPRGTVGRYWAWLVVPLLLFPIQDGKEQQEYIWFLESEYHAHLLYRHNDYVLVVSLNEGGEMSKRSVIHNVIPTLRYLDVDTIEWVGLNKPLSFTAQELEKELREQQKVRIVPACQPTQKIAGMNVNWHNFASGCVLRLSNTTGSLTMFAPLSREDMADVMPMLQQSGVIVALYSDQLSGFYDRKKQRWCLLPYVEQEVVNFSGCTVLDAHSKGATRWSTEHWQLTDDNTY